MEMYLVNDYGIEEIVETLLLTGISVTNVDGIADLYKKFKMIDFETVNVPEMNFLNKRITSKDINLRNGLTDPEDPKWETRESIFTSRDHETDYQELVNEFLDIIRPLWVSLAAAFMAKKEKYDISKFRESVGLHYYKKGKYGLHKHKDVDCFTILISDGPVDSDIGPLRVKGDQVLIFAGATLKEYDIRVNPLVHWVGEVKQETKFTVGAFIGPNNDEKFISEGKRQDFTVGKFVEDYFTPGTTVREKYHVHDK